MAKPASGTALNTGHALYANLLAVWAFLENTGTTSADSKGSRTLTLNATGGSNAGQWAADSAGDPSWKIISVNDNRPIQLSSAVSLDGTNSWSVAWRFKLAANDNNGILCGNEDIQEFFEAAGGYAFYQRAGGGGYTDHTFTNPNTFTTEADYVLTFDHAAGSNRCRHYKNGSEVASSPQAGTATQPLKFTTLAGGKEPGNFVWALQGTLSYFYVWDGRVLSGAEASSLASAPYGMFGAGGGGGGKPSAYYRMLRT